MFCEKLPYTLTVVIREDKEAVLMCLHNKFNSLNYVGGHVEENETLMAASYRELYEETGISPEDIDLYEIRREQVSSVASDRYWDMFITGGILKKPVKLVQEANKLIWIPLDVKGIHKITYLSHGFGNCFTYLMETLKILNPDKVEDLIDLINQV